jgi:hypothetical protein
VRQNSIRFGNLLTQAGRILTERQMKVSDALKSRLKQLEQLTEDDHFWQHQSLGLAVFLSDSYERRLHLPATVDEQVRVGEHFWVTPLAAQRETAQSYGVLTLTWQEAQLFEAHGQQLEPYEDSRFPLTMEQLVGIPDPEEQLQYESYRIRGAQGDNKAVYHGQGQGEGEIEADRHNYLSRIGQIVSALHYGRELPIVLVATQEVAGHFGAASEAKVYEHIEASPESLLGNQLPERVWAAMVERRRRDAEQVQERLGTAVARQLGSEDVQDIVVAAIQGRVDTLVVRAAEPVYGRFDEGEQRAELSSEGDRSAVDLVNVAVGKTWETGGKVMYLPSGNGDKSQSPLAAIYRFAS